MSPQTIKRDASPVSDALTIAARPVKLDAAVAILREHYGREVSASILDGEKDGNFHIRDRDGSEYLLKIVNPHEPVGVSDFQTLLLLHLEVANPLVPVQRVVRTRDGRPDFTIRFDDEGVRRVRLLTYMPGMLMRDASGGAQRQRNVGATLARLQLALVPFSHPCADHELIWDLQHAARLRPLLVSITDPGRRRMLEHRLDIFEGELAPALTTFRRQVVHNDFSGDNILVDPADTDRIAGILDFGDAVDTALINDVAVAAAYQLDAATNDPLAALQGFLSGFYSIRPLAAEEVEILYDLVITRMVMRLAITEWRAKRVPENRTYILRNTPTVWALFDQLSAVSSQAATAALRSVCQKGDF